MKWAPQQTAAIDRVADWYQNSDEQVFRLFGYAGTGKTTLAKHFAEGVNGQVMFGAYTGKASLVLQNKGCPATTIHKMIYRSKQPSTAKVKELEAELGRLLLIENPDSITQKKIKDYREELERERQNDARPFFDLNQDSDVRRASLVVIDECSMVDGQMGQDLMSFGCKILVLGDPAQLPPVGGAGFFTECKPDFLLDEVHRQAKDNPILELATRLREHRGLKLGTYGDSRVISVDDIDAETCISADQLIVGRNATRHSYNKRMRKLTNRTSPFPEPGDKVVCRRNDSETGLMNGAMFYVEDIGDAGEDYTVMTIRPDTGGDPIPIMAHTPYFFGDKVPYWEEKEAQQIHFGYAITCHTSQGSQWDDLVVFDESSAFREHKWRWAYTAMTRAAKSVTWVKM